MSNLKIYKGGSWVDICDLDFRIYVNGSWKRVKPGDKIRVNGQWKTISCTYPFEWVVDEDSSTCELTVPSYHFKSRYVNVSYPVTMTTGLTAGRPCGFIESFNASLDNHLPTIDYTENTTNLNLFGNTQRMFQVPSSGTYRVKAKLQGNIVCNNVAGVSQHIQTISFVFGRSGDIDVNLIPLGQNSLTGVSAADFCAPGQYVIQKGQTVPVNIDFNQNIVMAAGDVSIFKLIVNLETHLNQAAGAGESNTTNFNFTVHELEIEKL